MTTCYGYTRVSTVKQGEGVSLEAQKDEIIRYAEKHGLSISRWFEEKETAAKAGRPIFDGILRDLRTGKADGLIVHKIDRSARNFRDWAQIGELADQGVAIHFATESLDFQSQGGRLASQYFGQIEGDVLDSILGNVGTVIAFRTSPMDAPGLARHFDGVEPRDLNAMPNYRMMVRLMVDGERTKPFTAWGM